MPRPRNAAAGLNAAGRELDAHVKAIDTDIRDLERQLQAKKEERAEVVRVSRELATLGGGSRTAVAARRGRQPAATGRTRSAGRTAPATRGRRRQAQTATTTTTRRRSAGRAAGTVRSTDERVEQIRAALAKGPMTATEIAAATSMSQQRARQLMAYMSEQNMVTKVEQSGGRGRPKLIYSLAGRGSGSGRRGRAAATASTGTRGRRTQTAKSASAKRASAKSGTARGASAGRKRQTAKSASAKSATASGTTRRRGGGRRAQSAAAATPPLPETSAPAATLIEPTPVEAPAASTTAPEENGSTSTTE